MHGGAGRARLPATGAAECAMAAWSPQAPGASAVLTHTGTRGSAQPQTPQLKLALCAHGHEAGGQTFGALP